MKEILNIKNLKKIYHTKNEEILAVDNFSYSLLEGDFVSIVGPSGCGKSTILSILCGLVDKSDGNIEYDKDIKFGYMLQDDCLFPFRTILENCLLGLEINHTLNEENKNYVLHLLETYGLKEFVNRYPDSLSGGMRQRVALIRTLAMKPDILLLDEPFSALDYQSRLAVSDDVYKIIKKEHKTTIMITHNIEEAIAFADRVVVLSKRPSIIKAVFDIKLSDASTPINNRKCVEFNDYYEEIWQEFDHEI